MKAILAVFLAAASAANRTTGPETGAPPAVILPAAIPAPPTAQASAPGAVAPVPALLQLTVLLHTPMELGDTPASPAAAESPSQAAARPAQGVTELDLKLFTLLERAPDPHRRGGRLEAAAVGAPEGPQAAAAALQSANRMLEQVSLAELQSMPAEDLEGFARRVMDEVLAQRSIEGADAALPGGGVSPRAALAPPAPKLRRRVLKALPLATGVIVAANAAAYSAEVSAVSNGAWPEDIFRTWGLWPFAMRHALAQFDLAEAAWRAATTVTSLFVHAGLDHLVSNLVTLSLFGIVVERALGAKRLLTLYLAAGVAGSLAHLALSWGSFPAAVGASGAVAGVMGAFLVTPGAAYAFKSKLARAAAAVTRAVVSIATTYWLLGELGRMMQQLRGWGFDGIAHDVHVGGFLGGVAIALWWRLRAKGGGPASREESRPSRP